MTDYARYRKGDLVRVLPFEAEVTEDSKDFRLVSVRVTTHGYAYGLPLKLHRAALQRIAQPLPTTPGSVIRGFSDSECGSKGSPVTFMLRDPDEPRWVCSDHGYVVTSPELLEDVEVIFDAGVS